MNKGQRFEDIIKIFLDKLGIETYYSNIPTPQGTEVDILGIPKKSHEGVYATEVPKAPIFVEVTTSYANNKKLEQIKRNSVHVLSTSEYKKMEMRHGGLSAILLIADKGIDNAALTNFESHFRSRDMVPIFWDRHRCMFYAVKSLRFELLKKHNEKIEEMYLSKDDGITALFGQIGSGIFLCSFFYHNLENILGKKDFRPAFDYISKISKGLCDSEVMIEFHSQSGFDYGILPLVIDDIRGMGRNIKIYENSFFDYSFASWYNILHSINY